MALLSGSGKGDFTVSKKDEKPSRFDGFLKAARAPKQNDETPSTETSKHSDIRASEHRNIQLAKSKDPHYQRTTVYLPKPLHRKLKAIVAAEDGEISDIVEKLIQDWLESRKNLDV